MTTAECIIAEVSRQGIELRAEGDRLRFRPVSALTSDLRDELARHKAEVLAILSARPGRYVTPDDLPEQWQEYYQERAGIREFEGGQCREHAEAEAWGETVAAMWRERV